MYEDGGGNNRWERAHGREARGSRSGREGEGGVGGGAGGSDDERTGVASSACIRRRSASGSGSCSTARRSCSPTIGAARSEDQDALIAELYEQIGRLQMEAAG